MKCVRCGGATGVVETRPGPLLSTQRRRECECCGHRFSTYETHSTVFRHNRAKAVQFARATAKRIALRRRDIEIADNLYKGWQPLAKKYGLTHESTVYYAAARGRRYKAQELRRAAS